MIYALKGCLLTLLLASALGVAVWLASGSWRGGAIVGVSLLAPAIFAADFILQRSASKDDWNPPGVG